eukprot:scaffold1604_cov127-Isochrysis_galbana.AAC.1
MALPRRPLRQLFLGRVLVQKWQPEPPPLHSPSAALAPQPDTRHLVTLFPSVPAKTRHLPALTRSILANAEAVLSHRRGRGTNGHLTAAVGRRARSNRRWHAASVGMGCQRALPKIGERARVVHTEGAIRRSTGSEEGRGIHR